MRKELKELEQRRRKKDFEAMFLRLVREMAKKEAKGRRVRSERSKHCEV